MMKGQRCANTLPHGPTELPMSHQQPITRAEARAQGLKTYFTGKPCKHGNMADRGVASPYCLCRACRDERNGRSRGWRAEYPDRQVASTQQWIERNPEKYAAKVARASAKQENRRKTDEEFAAAERARIRDLQKKRHHRLFGVDGEYTMRCRVNSAHQKVNRRRARQTVSLTPAEQVQVKAIYRLRYMLTQQTGIEYHVDHRIPLAKGGLHHPNNLWVITAAENMSKGAKLLP